MTDATDMRPEKIAPILAALSDPSRLAIFQRIAAGRGADAVSPPHPEKPHCVCPYLDVQRALPDIQVSRFSYHLRRLREAGLVVEHRLGKLVYYEADLTPLDAVDLFLRGKVRDA